MKEEQRCKSVLENIQKLPQMDPRKMNKIDRNIIFLLTTHRNTRHHQNETTDSWMQSRRKRVSVVSEHRVINDLDDGAVFPQQVC